MDVLVVDDNSEVRELLRRYLSPHDLRVHEAVDRQDAVARSRERSFDLVFIDWVLCPWSKLESELNGVAVCRALRDAGETAPVVMYSSVARSAQSLINALDAGADEFMESPLSNLEELAARLRALRRRREWTATVRPLEIGAISADLDKREARVNGTPVHLTKAEFDLLAHLVRYTNRVVPREDLARSVLGTRRSDGSSNALVMLIQRLRAKLGMAARQIETVRGAGYRLSDGV